jgi:hypothetical protein
MKLNSTAVKLWMLAALTVLACLATFAQSTNRFDPHNFATFKLINERNIFDPSRRPSRPNMFTNPPPVYSFSLRGTMNYEKGLYAVFDGTSQDYHKVLESGGKIAVYTVSDITHESCKLTYGTNQIELKVGMQMRRNTDGSWSSAEQIGEASFAFNANSRFGNNGRFNRFDRNNNGGDRTDRRFGSGGGYGRNNYRNGDRSYGYGGNDSNAGGGPGGGMDNGGSASPANAGSTDPNDVVARLMAARAAQMGGNAGQQNEGGNQPPDQNQNYQGGNQNENANANQNVPNENQNVPNENQGAPANGNQNNSNVNQNGNEPGTPRI